MLVRDKTLAELKDLNIAAQFVNDAGETPYTDLHGDAVPDELRILSLDEVLDYLTSAGDYRYIIEIKDGGEVGLAAADQLYATLNERNLLDRVIVGSFRDEVRTTSRRTTRTCTAAPARRRSCSSTLPP